MRLRDVRLDDVDVYLRMRCDPVMMAELGGPLPPNGMADKVRRDVAEAAADREWIKMILPDDTDPDTVAGSVVLWRPEHGDRQLSEIGWMVLPEFQGRGIGTAGVRMLLDLARADQRWGVVHAYPKTTNQASNGICRTLGFTLAGDFDIEWYGRTLRSNDWWIDTAAR